MTTPIPARGISPWPDGSIRVLWDYLQQHELLADPGAWFGLREVRLLGALGEADLEGAWGFLRAGDDPRESMRRVGDALPLVRAACVSWDAWPFGDALRSLLPREVAEELESIDATLRPDGLPEILIITGADPQGRLGYPELHIRQHKGVTHWEVTPAPPTMSIAHPHPYVAAAYDNLVAGFPSDRRYNRATTGGGQKFYKDLDLARHASVERRKDWAEDLAYALYDYLSGRTWVRSDPHAIAPWRVVLHRRSTKDGVPLQPEGWVPEAEQSVGPISASCSPLTFAAWNAVPILRDRVNRAARQMSNMIVELVPAREPVRVVARTWGGAIREPLALVGRLFDMSIREAVDHGISNPLRMSETATRCHLEMHQALAKAATNRALAPWLEQVLNAYNAIGSPDARGT